MVSMLVYSSDMQEMQNIRLSTKDLAAYISQEKWDISCFSSLKEVGVFLQKQPLINLACYDVTENGSLDILEKVRKNYSDMLLMVIADQSLSPMEYVRPDILASSLILRPFSEQLLREKLRDIMWKHISRTEDKSSQDAFVIEAKEGKTWIPYNQIYYMEARDKKIYIRLKNREIAFHGVMEELEKTLPDNFIRCHRSFLINKTYIEQIFLSKSEIHLSHGICIPLSRSYKPQFKAYR